MNSSTSGETIIRGRILDAADVQFRRFGPRKTSMEEIAQKAGLSRATLYLHFSGKKELYQALLRTITIKFVGKVEQLVRSDQSAPNKFRKFVELTAVTYADNPIFVAALTEDKDFSLQNTAGPLMADYRSEILGAVRLILQQGIEERSVRQLNIDETAYLLYEFGNQLLLKEISGTSDYPLNKILDTMDDIMARGILNLHENDQ